MHFPYLEGESAYRKHDATATGRARNEMAMRKLQTTQMWKLEVQEREMERVEE